MFRLQSTRLAATTAFRSRPLFTQNIFNNFRQQRRFSPLHLFASSSTASSFFYFYFSSASVATTVALCASPQEDFAKKIDNHHDNDRVVDSYSDSKQALENFPDDIELMWRHARALYLMGKEQTDRNGDKEWKKKKEEFIRAAVDLLDKCLQKNPEHWAANKWMGMALGAKGEFIALKEKIGNSFKIKDNFQKAIAGNPRDATSFHCMGAWCWNILQVSGMERSVASWIFATPPTTSFEECEENLLKSHELDQTQIHNSLLLGDLYAWKGRKDDAAKWYYHGARECPVNTEYQRDYVKEAEKKLVGLRGEKWEDSFKK